MKDKVYTQKEVDILLQDKEKEMVERIVPRLLKDKPNCTEDRPCGCHFGEVFHADSKCMCDIKEELLNSLKGENEN